MKKTFLALISLMSAVPAFAIDFSVRAQDLNFHVGETADAFEMRLGTKIRGISKKSCAMPSIERFSAEFARLKKVAHPLRSQSHYVETLLLLEEGKRQYIDRKSAFGKWLEKVPYNFVAIAREAEEACK